MMAEKTNKNSPVARLHINQSAKAKIADVFRAQYSHLEKGELRTLLETVHNPVWDENEFADEFDIIKEEGVVGTVVHKETKKHGTVLFTDSPRFYFDFEESGDERP
jgi:hypothetical protein